MSSPSYVVDDYYTLQEQRIMAIVPKLSAGLSLPSSAFIIYEAIQDQRNGKGTAIQRALISMSAFDILSSFAWFMSSWLVPEGFIAYSAGNQGTCDLQGFLLLAAVGVPMSNSTLAVFYLLIIRQKWTDSQIAKIEPYIHGFIWLFAIGCASALLPLGVYNPIGVICWMAEPWDCQGGVSLVDGTPCDRGQNAWLYATVLFYAPLYTAALIVIVCMCLIYVEVRKTHRRLQRYSAGGTNIQELSRSADDVKKVAVQAVLYSSSFFVTFIPSTIWSVMGYMGSDPFGIVVASLVCEPLQGFWNCIIFVRKRPDTRRKIRAFFCCHSCRRGGDGTEQQHQEQAQGKRTKRTSLLGMLRRGSTGFFLGSDFSSASSSSPMQRSSEELPEQYPGREMGNDERNDPQEKDGDDDPETMVEETTAQDDGVEQNE